MTDDTQPLSRQQRAVLEKLSNATGSLFGRDFKDLATVRNGKWEWAGPILQRLEGKGFAARVGPKTEKGFGWRITPAGRSALARPSRPEKRPAARLSKVMGNEIVTIGRRQQKGSPYDAICNRVTHEALERRGLVTVRQLSSGWRLLRLTEAGVEKFSRLIGEEVTLPPEDEDADAWFD